MSYLILLVMLFDCELYFQRGEAKLLTEDWEGAVEDLKSAAQKSPQVCYVIDYLMFIQKNFISSCNNFVLCFITLFQ